jgi:hypothetical protein
LSKAKEISTDVISAIQEQDVNKLAPKSLSYGKAVFGLQSFRKQLVTDIIPNIFTKTVPKLFDEGPRVFSSIIQNGQTDILEKGQSIFTQVREISQDPTLLQSTVEDVRREMNNVPSYIQSTVGDVRREMKNVVKSNPEGLEQPSYVVVKTTEDYEIRMYAPYTVCSTEITSLSNEGETITLDPLVTSTSFNKLASYIFGANNKTEKISMTVPVIIDSKNINFVLPKNIDASSAPLPNIDSITIKNVPSELIAVREFTGIATESETNQQRGKLEDFLISDGIVYDSESFKVLQYNPPYTLPWVRRNEVSFVVTMSEYIAHSLVNNNENHASNTFKNDFESKDASKFYSAPEAGD